MLHYNKPLKRSQPYIKAHKHVQGRNEDHARSRDTCARNVAACTPAGEIR